jgi:hypothetical protein
MHNHLPAQLSLNITLSLNCSIKMMNMKINFTLMLICLLSHGCSTPSSITRLSPINGSGKWKDGQELHTFENDSLRIVIVADDLNQQKLGFVVSILNKSKTEQLYSSDNFQLYPVHFRKRNKYNYTYAQIEDTLNADDPEQIIIQEQYKMNRAVANMQNNATWSLLHSTLHLATDILVAATPTNTTTNKQQINDNHVNRYDNQLFESGIYRNAIEYMSSEDAIAILKTKAFRKNTVDPGAVYGGTVQFARMNYAQKIALRIKLNGQVLVFQFQQKIYINEESIDN